MNVLHVGVEMRAVDLRAEHGWPALGIGTATPRLSWRTETELSAWRQAEYELEVDGVAQGPVDTADSVLVAWPAAPLRSRQQATIRVRVRGVDGSESGWSDPLTIEAGLLRPEDWSATWITPVTPDLESRSVPAPHFRRLFTVDGPPGATLQRARLYVTSAGVHRLEINGSTVGDHVLSPGWSSYPQRLRYETHDVTALVRDGENVIGAVVADGWWRGNLGFSGNRNTYGDRLGLLAQLELAWADGTTQVVTTSDGDWRTSTGAILTADLYDGETHDARCAIAGWSGPEFDDATWAPVEAFTPSVGSLVTRVGPPVRRIEELTVAEVLTSPSGATILDFGQNLVGRLRFTVEGPTGTTVTLHHAEVLEHGELALEPLRGAQATDRYTLRGDGPETWEPEFTFHGFRYAEVIGWPGPLDPAAFAAVVLHSDMERTGTFSCSHELLNRFHENVVWGMRGNFLDVPTDCPQRDERLGWTGDLQVFTPTASFLYDVSGFLSGWLDDLRAEQRPDGSVPVIIPMIDGMPLPTAAAAWSDAATVVPTELHRHHGDAGVLADQYESVRAWVDYVADRAGKRRLWTGDFQFGDWLDPTAPNDKPWLARTDPGLVASAYFARSARLVSEAAAQLSRPHDAEHYASLADDIATAFRDEYLTPRGRLMSDSATAYALAVEFDLVTDPDQRSRLVANLARIARANFFTITTGFVGTPLVLPVLGVEGHLGEAYELMLQTGCPSWLYPVTMGATTVWERWDSMLPDGTVNGSGMTSFNHYALGAAAQWLHEVVGGIAPAEPGYRTIAVAPRPGGGVTHAEASLRTPYGPARCRWSVDGAGVELEVVVPPNSTALVTRPGLDGEVGVGSGTHQWAYWVPDEVAATWAPLPSPWEDLA